MESIQAVLLGREDREDEDLETRSREAAYGQLARWCLGGRRVVGVVGP